MKTFLALTIGSLVAVAPGMAQNWAAVPNPTAQRTEFARSVGYCADPWITLAIWMVQAGTRNPNGVGQIGECDPQRYNGGRWSSFGQLLQAYSDTDRALSSQGARTLLQDNRNNTLTVSTIDGSAFDKTVIAGRIAIPNGANYSTVTHILGNSAAGVVSTGAGNIVSHDGGTLIGQDGAGYMLLTASRVKVRLPGGRAMILGR
jgi:hypothetical protein